MRYVKWILVGIAAIIGYKVFRRVEAYRAANKGQTTKTDATARRPGMVSNLLDDLTGAFNLGPNPSVPPTPSGYGPGAPGISAGTPFLYNEGYTAPDSDTRIPTFLQGVTGGVQDPAMPGSSPPGIIGPAPIGGSNQYTIPWYSRALMAMHVYQQPSGIASTNPPFPVKSGSLPN